MKKLAIFAAVTLGLAAPAVAQDASVKAEVVEKNARDQATKVRIEGKVYDVCMNEAQDSCIQPRAAGLNWGDVPLNHWPGQPASERRG